MQLFSYESLNATYAYHPITCPPVLLHFCSSSVPGQLLPSKCFGASA